MVVYLGSPLSRFREEASRKLKKKETTVETVKTWQHNCPAMFDRLSCSKPWLENISGMFQLKVKAKSFILPDEIRWIASRYPAGYAYLDTPIVVPKTPDIQQDLSIKAFDVPFDEISRRLQAHSIIDKAVVEYLHRRLGSK